MKPRTRLDHFLAKIAGDKSAKNLTPRSSKEYYLNEIAENGGGGVFVIPIIEDVSTPGEYTTTTNREAVSDAIAKEKRIVFSDVFGNQILATGLLNNDDLVSAETTVAYVSNASITFKTYGVSWSTNKEGQWQPAVVTYKVANIQR